ncbi:MAG: hypothetical protein ACYDH9_23065 [Limisphaerales bacterium]
MSTPAKPPVSEPAGFVKRFVLPALSRGVTFVVLGIAILLLLLRRFNINTSHGISPAEAEKVFKHLKQNEHKA